MKSLLLTTMIGLSISLCGVATGQDVALNTKWQSEYESVGGEKVAAKITLKKQAQEQYGSGKFETEFGNGVLSQVRRDVASRKSTKPIPAGGPLPGPNSPNAGATTNEAVYLKGIWTFQGKTGWFSWELYETPGNECKFVGKWGFVENNQAGPVQGKWTGALVTGNQGNQNNSNTNVPVINIPF
ncbi:MAG: hypothetical protein HKN47_05680 [Pirellulaceae bacterium]|nr:hypothetical protein [Pirellulaceae bacterium]